MIALVDYGAGNLRSVYNALQLAGARDVQIARDAATIARAERIILPGVGAFAAAMQGLQAIPDSIDILQQRVRGAGVPFLGICVGMQILADVGEEHGDCAGLGWIAGRVQRLAESRASGAGATEHALAIDRVPHIGWNDIRPTATAEAHAVIKCGVGYFLHSYHFTQARAADILATSDHSGACADAERDGERGAAKTKEARGGQAALIAAVARDNIMGVQFHPEKSQRYGIEFLQRFLAWKP